MVLLLLNKKIKLEFDPHGWTTKTSCSLGLVAARLQSIWFTTLNGCLC